MRPAGGPLIGPIRVSCAFINFTMPAWHPSHMGIPQRLHERVHCAPAMNHAVGLLIGYILSS